MAPDQGSGASYAEQVYVIARQLIAIFLGLQIGHRVTGYIGELQHVRPECVPEIAIEFVNRDDRKWLGYKMISPFPFLGLEARTS